MRARLILFFLLHSAIYHSNLRPVASGDSLPSSLVPLSVVLDGSATLDRFGPWIHENVRYSSAIVYRTGGRWHSTYPVAGAVLVSPLYAPAALVPGVRDLPPLR